LPAPVLPRETPSPRPRKSTPECTRSASLPHTQHPTTDVNPEPAYFSNSSSPARLVAFTTALMSVTRSLPSSNSIIPSMVHPAGHLQVLRPGVCPGANPRHSASHGRRGIGHRAHHGHLAPQTLLDVARGHGCGNGNDQRLLIQLRRNLLQHLAHHLRLHAQE